MDEADIGLIRDAQKRKQPVAFTVEAYPKDKFQGTIREVRLTPTTVQNIVTYTVVVEAANPQLKLLPGMTPTLKFQIETRAQGAESSQRGAAVLSQARPGSRLRSIHSGR